MLKLLEAIFDALEPQPQLPLHVGEVMTLWTYAVVIDEGRALCEFLLNQTGDPEMKRLIEHLIADVEVPQINRLHTFMRDHGINPPMVIPSKAKLNHKEVPPAVKLTDTEIADAVVLKMKEALETLSSGLVQVLRVDVGNMLLQFYLEVLKEGFVLKQTMQRRGWLKVPPHYYPGLSSSE